MQKPTLQQTIGELERELATRNKVYPRWIREGKITEGTANHRRDCISEAIRLLDELCLLTRRAGATQLTFADPGDCPTRPWSPRNGGELR
jgi:hypothetical protein